MTNSLPVILNRLRLFSEKGVRALLKQDTVNVGIGFATGRKSFRKVLKTNILSWQECGLTQNPKFNLNLFVAYDLKYANTKVTDYTSIPPYLLKDLDGTFFLGKTAQPGARRRFVAGRGEPLLLRGLRRAAQHRPLLGDEKPNGLSLVPGRRRIPYGGYQHPQLGYLERAACSALSPAADDGHRSQHHPRTPLWLYFTDPVHRIQQLADKRGFSDLY